MLKVGSHINWEFEGFKVLTEARLLLNEGAPVPLTSKSFDTLVLLIANRDASSPKTNCSNRSGPTSRWKKAT